MAEQELENTIDVWGGRARQGIFELYPFSLDALGESRDKSQSTKCTPMFAFLNKFPTISYSTDWGNWDESNTAFVTKSLKTFGGGGESIPARIVQMLAGPNYQPPITSDKWTQLTAQLSDQGAYMKLDLELIAYPIFKTTSYHVEGLRYDSSNLGRILENGRNRMNSIYDWLSLGQKAMMPKQFSTKFIKDNVLGMKENLTGEGTSGKAILAGAHKMAHVVDGIIPGNEISFQDAVANGVAGLETFVRGVCGTHQRYGHTFTCRIRNDDRKIYIDSNKPKAPVDFYIENMSFKFSPHLVKIVDHNGNRKGITPEYALINISLKSVCAVSREQFMEMYKYTP